MDLPGGLRLKWRLRCGRGGRLLEWHSWTSSREEREKRDAQKMRDESESHVLSVLSVSRGARSDQSMTRDSIVYA
jgi:hypothetical protein